MLTYGAEPLEVTSLSSWVQVSDLLTNPSEEVRGLGLNYDGTLGVVRGQFAAYFMSPPDLRLQGLTEIPMATVGAGATLHPLHANARTLENLGGEYRPDTHLAFVASGEHTIDIIDTQRFTRIGRVYIRDIVNGPLRAVLPYPGNGVVPGDNADFQCATIPVTDKRGNVHRERGADLREWGLQLSHPAGRDHRRPLPGDEAVRRRRPRVASW